MLFSVIIPVYNAENYLDECIQSVINQTFDDWEIILVDDGSVDSGGNICDRYHEKYPNKIKVFHKKNEGQILTRCYGIRNSDGEYFVFLDADDMLRHDCLEKIKSVIDNFDSDMIIYNFSKSTDCSGGYSLPLVPGIVEKNDIYKLICTSNLLNNMCTKCVKRDCFDINADYSKYAFMRNAEDLLQSLPIIDKCINPYYLDDALYYYRTNPHSVTNTYQPNRAKSIKTVMYVLKSYVEKWNIDIELYNRNAHYTKLRMYKYVLTSTLSIGQKIKKMGELSRDEFYRIRYNKKYAGSLNFKSKVLYMFVCFINMINGKNK